MTKEVISADQLDRHRLKDEFIHLLQLEGYGRWYWAVPTGEVTWCPQVYRTLSIASFDNRIESFQSHVHPLDLEQGIERLATMLKQGFAFSSYLRIRGDDGNYRRFYNCGKPILDRRGRAIGILGYVRRCRPDEYVIPQADLPTETEPSRGITDLAPLTNALIMTGRSKDPETRAQAEQTFLEFVLTRTNSALQARQLARRLYAKFRSFAAVMTADEQEILSVEGACPKHVALFQIIRLATASMLRPQEAPAAFDDHNALLFYLRSMQAYKTREQFRVVFLNKERHIIDDEVMSEGSVDFTPVFIRDVIKRALDLHAQFIILVHNHPSGNPSPSAADVQMTRRLAQAALSVGLIVDDHIVLGKYGHASLRARGLL